MHINVYYDWIYISHCIFSKLTCIFEFRDISWFDGEVYDTLNDYKAGFCSVSSPDLPEDLIGLSKILYIRFHGKGEEKYRYLYSIEELNKWAQNIKKSKAKIVFSYFNNDYDAHAPQNASMLRDIL